MALMGQGLDSMLVVEQKELELVLEDGSWKEE